MGKSSKNRKNRGQGQQPRFNIFEKPKDTKKGKPKGDGVLKHLQADERMLLIHAKHLSQLEAAQLMPKGERLGPQLAELLSRLASERATLHGFALAVHSELENHGVSDDLGNAVKRIRILAGERDDAKQQVIQLEQKLKDKNDD